MSNRLQHIRLTKTFENKSLFDLENDINSWITKNQINAKNIYIKLEGSKFLGVINYIKDQREKDFEDKKK